MYRLIVNSKDTLFNEHALELKNELVKHNIINEDLEIENYQQLPGGADTTIFEISFKNHPQIYLQRIFRAGVPNKFVEYEYNNQKTLYENGVSVPRTYFQKPTPNTFGRSYFVMDKIEGIILGQKFFQTPNLVEQDVKKFIRELYKIHSIDPGLFSQIPIHNIEENPFALIDRTLSNCNNLVRKFPDDLVELIPLIQWLEENKTKNPCTKLVVIHGDYHPFNVIVNEDNQLIILDWTGINISDFRRELGFTAVLTTLIANQDLITIISNYYEELSGIKVENLDYFMVLGNLFNIVRFYSVARNYDITNENDATRDYFKSVKVFPLFVVDMVQRLCNVELKQIREFFNAD